MNNEKKQDQNEGTELKPLYPHDSLRQLKSLRRLGVQEIAQRAGVSIGTVNECLKGSPKVGVEKFASIADALGADVEISLRPSDAVQAMKDSVKTEIIEVGGQPFLTRPIHLPPAEKTLDPVITHTLSGLAQFVAVAINAKQPIELVHVVSPECVDVLGPITGRHSQRTLLARAQFKPGIGSNFNFGKFHDPETFIIALLALFEDSGHRPAVLQLVGTMKNEQVRTSEDNGYSQNVKAKSGVVLVKDVEVPNPVTLSPRRTFQEVAQPASPFLLRVRNVDSDEPPHAALFEADGGTWRVAAVNAIADFLRHSDMPTDIPIIA